MLDPEILEAFKTECFQLLEELTAVVESLEDWSDAGFPSKLLEEFAGKVDRIMGTSKTMLQMEPENKGLQLLSKLGELCKATGYKAATANFLPLIPIFAAFWSDTLEIIQEVLENIENEASLQKITTESGLLLQNRLRWLAQQVMTLTKDQANSQQSLISVDALLKNLIS